MKGNLMLIHPTAERLRALGLAAMADALIELQGMPDATDLPREDWLGLLVDRETTSRENRRLTRRLREARLRQTAVIEDTDFRAPRGLDRALFQKLADCNWIRDHNHLIIGGPTGVGKSWLACALGHIADDRCDKGSLLITSQIPVTRWHEVIGDPTLADAILDRIVHRAHRLDLKGESLRKRRAAGDAPLTDDPAK
jgi:DNA replication protein DnaC